MLIKTGKTLSSLRKSHNYTQQEVADRINVSRPTYSSWEKNNSDISLSQLIGIIKIYQISLLLMFRMLEIENKIDLLSKDGIDETIIFMSGNESRFKNI